MNPTPATISHVHGVQNHTPHKACHTDVMHMGDNSWLQMWLRTRRVGCENGKGTKGRNITEENWDHEGGVGLVMVDSGLFF